jgi:hypothetical protein
VAPGGEFHSSELPILLPELRGLIERPDQIAILDVGGDNIGATVLASLSDVFARADYEMYFVINMNRPFTGTVEGVIRIMREIEEASRLKITALVSNTHLIDESTVKNIVQGAEFAGEVAKAADLPLAFIGVMEQFIPKLKDYNLPYPLMPMKRHLLPPWALKKRSIGRLSTHSRDRFGQLTK